MTPKNVSQKEIISCIAEGINEDIIITKDVKNARVCIRNFKARLDKVICFLRFMFIPELINIWYV